MSKAKFFISLILAISLLVGQVGIVFAAPALQKSTLISGIVQSITLETDSSTGITTVTVEVKAADQTTQTLRISQGAAVTIGLVSLDGDGNPLINNLALGKPVEIDPATVIPNQPKDRHPVGIALATFFPDIADYDTIMIAHDQGVGFGVIAQALWLTKQLNGNADVFKALLDARETGDYSAFSSNDGPTPKNWGQLRKAILDGKITGTIVSNQNNDNGNSNVNGKGHGQGNDKGNGNTNGKGNGKGNGKDKDKNKKK